MTKLKKESVFYSASFKRKVLTSIERGEMSAYEAGRHYGIKGSMTVYRWIDQQEKILGHTFAETTSAMGKKQEVCQEELTAELAALKKLLSLERLRSESYLMMIKLAEEKYGLPIEKKSGTKQSK